MDLVPDGLTPWEHFSHEADIGIRGFGASLEQAFEHAALALTGVITDPALVVPRIPVDVDCHAPDDELLLIDWINALVYEMDIRGMLFGRFQVSIDRGRLHGVATGESVDVLRHQPAVEVKGATYTACSVRQNSHRLWAAQCVVDV